MDYMTLKEAAEKWGVTPRRVNSPLQVILFTNIAVLLFIYQKKR